MLHKKIAWLAIPAFVSGLLAIDCPGQGKLAQIRDQVEAKPDQKKTRPADKAPGKGGVIESARNSANATPPRQRRHGVGGRNRGRSCCPPAAPLVIHSWSTIDRPTWVEQAPPIEELPAEYWDLEIEPQPNSSTPVFEQPDWFESWGWRPTFYYGGNFGSLSTGGLGILAQAPAGLGIDIQAVNWREQLSGATDSTWLGDVNLVLEQNSGSIRTRLGLGVNWMADAWASAAGFNLTAGTDIQLTERWLLTAEIDFGSLGSSDLLHMQATAGYALKRSELFLGYSHYQIGNSDLGGMISGFRWRF